MVDGSSSCGGKGRRKFDRANEIEGFAYLRSEQLGSGGTVYVSKLMFVVGSLFLVDTESGSRTGRKL